MLTRLVVDFAGERQLSRAFDALERDVADLSEPLRDVHEHLRRTIGDQFESEGARAGGRWTDLSQDYKQEKESEVGFVYPMLVRSGTLRGAMLAREPLELGPRRLVFGIDPAATYDDGTTVEEVAVAHQTGAGNLPERRIVALTEGDKRQVDRIVVSWVSSRARRLIGLG